MSMRAIDRDRIGWCHTRLIREYSGTTTPCSVRQAFFTDSNGTREPVNYTHWKKCKQCEAHWVREKHSELELEISIKKGEATAAGVKARDIDAIVSEVEAMSARNWDVYLASMENSRYEDLASAEHTLVNGMHGNIHAAILEAQRGKKKKKKGKK